MFDEGGNSWECQTVPFGILTSSAKPGVSTELIPNRTVGEFDRLCREGRFENRVCAGPPRELYMASELRRYRAQDKRLGASPRAVTNACAASSKSADLGVTSETEINTGEGKALGTTNDTWAI